MANCYVWKGIGTDGNTYTFAGCANEPNWQISHYPWTSGAWYAPYDGDTQLIMAWLSTPGSITQIDTREGLTAAQNGSGGNWGGCHGCIDKPPGWDCINGSCVAGSQYNTPGLYESLSKCEADCGAGGGIVIGEQDWAMIEGLAAQLKNLNCS